MDTSGEFEIYGLLWAGFHTALTPNTLPREKTDLQSRFLGLRAVAENAPEGTSLEEDDAADAGSIFKAVPLDINDEREFIHLDNTQLAAKVSDHECVFVHVVEVSFHLDLVF